MRRVAFGLVVVALGAALLLVGKHSSRSPQAATTTIRPAVRPTAAFHPRTPARRPPPTPGALHQARRFLDAFLSYEVGVGGSRTERAIRADASHGFAVELLTHRPTPPGAGAPPPARIKRMRVDPVRGRADLALVSGEARRRAGPEPFAFLFARRHGRWLALAPGE
jgi:hypothetical protein